MECAAPCKESKVPFTLEFLKGNQPGYVFVVTAATDIKIKGNQWTAEQFFEALTQPEILNPSANSNQSVGNLKGKTFRIKTRKDAYGINFQRCGKAMVMNPIQLLPTASNRSQIAFEVLKSISLE